jgi:hypothetical protein
MESMPAPAGPVTVGVDTHLETHVAAVVDQAGRLCGSVVALPIIDGSPDYLVWILEQTEQPA